MTTLKNKPNNLLWTGALIGFVFSILTGIVTTWLQHSLSKEELRAQYFLDEKKMFLEACEEYLYQYREWHELMNYYIYSDSDNLRYLSEHDSISAINTLKQWRRDIDRAYGKIFLLSENDFGTITLTISTILYNSLYSVIYSDFDQEIKAQILKASDNFFFENWLARAHDELNNYNTGKRREQNSAQVIDGLRKFVYENEGIILQLAEPEKFTMDSIGQ